MPNASFIPETGVVSLNGEDVAFVLFRSKRRKGTIAFKVERDSSLRVLAPLRASLGVVERVLKKRAAWVLREREACKNDNKVEAYADGSAFPYLGHACVLRVTKGGGLPGGCRLSPHALHVHVPDETLSPEALRQEVRLEISLWLKRRARTFFKKRLDLWAGRLGASYRRVAVVAPERRWGSCSADNVIRLNWRLMMAPLAILDYVAAHELAHVRHKNHGPRFWSFLAETMPDFQRRRKILRELERRLMI